MVEGYNSLVSQEMVRRSLVQSRDGSDVEDILQSNKAMEFSIPKISSYKLTISAKYSKQDTANGKLLKIGLLYNT